MEHNLFSNPLIEVPIVQLLWIWGELVESYHGINGFGGNTAEIYAYRLQGYSPMAHTHKNQRQIADKANQAASAIVALCEEFQRAHECTILLDGQGLNAWLTTHRHGEFDHRVHVQVTK
jgi:hypothetical protein